MISKINDLFPPDFCEVLTVFKKSSDGSYVPKSVGRCKFSEEKREYGSDVLKSTEAELYARIPLGKIDIVPDDIVVRGIACGRFLKQENGEDILKKFKGSSFRVTSVSFCGNHIYVKGREKYYG